MAGFFSKTAYNRLPAVIKKMPKPAQTACILLRLRKTEEQISGEMNIPLDEASGIVKEVKRTLITSGNYDLIADPVFVSLDAYGEEGGYEPPASEESPENRILIENFISALKDALSALEPEERRILHLFFERNMTGVQIADFYKQSGHGPTLQNPSDVFSLIEKALKKLVARMADATPIGRGTLTVKGLKEVFRQTGLQVAL